MCFKNLRFLKQVPTVLEITDGEKWKNNFWSDLLVVMIFLFIMVAFLHSFSLCPAAMESSFVSICDYCYAR